MDRDQSTRLKEIANSEDEGEMDLDVDMGTPAALKHGRQQQSGSKKRMLPWLRPDATNHSKPPPTPKSTDRANMGSKSTRPTASTVDARVTQLQIDFNTLKQDVDDDVARMEGRIDVLQEQLTEAKERLVLHEKTLGTPDFHKIQHTRGLKRKLNMLEMKISTAEDLASDISRELPPRKKEASGPAEAQKDVRMKDAIREVEDEAASTESDSEDLGKPRH